MDIFWEEITSGLPDSGQLVRVLIRLAAAMLLGAAVGIQRQKAHKPAGMRTYMLVSLGTAVFILSCSGFGICGDDLSLE